MVKCGVFFAARTELSNIMLASYGFKRSTVSTVAWNNSHRFPYVHPNSLHRFTLQTQSSAGSLHRTSRVVWVMNCADRHTGFTSRISINVIHSVQGTFSTVIMKSASFNFGCRQQGTGTAKVLINATTTKITCSLFPSLGNDVYTVRR
jgi:hypothetical protein